MTATRMNRKRSHDDIEDADECLPISKRINSLHIEGQAQAVSHQQVPLPNQANPFHELSEDIASTSANSHLMNQNSAMYGQQYNDTRYLDLSGQPLLSSMMPGAMCGHAPVPMPPGHLMYSLQAGTSQSQAELYQQPDMHKNISPQHLPLGTFSNLTEASSLSQGILDIAGHSRQDVTYSAATNPMGAMNDSLKCNKCDEQQIPCGPYEPELGVSENPHYFDVNRLLYEAHLSRIQRTST